MRSFIILVLLVAVAAASLMPGSTNCECTSIIEPGQSMS